MPVPDLEPPARAMAALVRNVRDDQLGAPTPCAEYSLGDLLDHVAGLPHAFIAAGRKDAADSQVPPPGDAARLEEGWRERLVQQLDELVEVWHEPGAWEGMTRIAGADTPAEMVGLILLDELVIHGWDVARASGQAYEPDPAALDAVQQFVDALGGPGLEGARGGPFGAVVPLPDEATRFDRILALTGRDPAWSGAS